MTDHLWSGRFAVAPDADVFGFQSSFAFDRRLFEDDVTGSLAWVEALASAGVLSDADAAAMSAALGEILETGRRDPSFVAGADEDVHAFVERQLVARVGEAGKRLHTGRSRNDQVSVDLRLYVRRVALDLQGHVRGVISALVEQAGSAGQALMPAYTHLRRAQPILVAHFLLAHAEALRRDDARFDHVRDEADAMPLGSGAVAGSSYAIDTAGLAARLGFSRVVANSLDATADRDFVASFLHACALTMVHLSRIAEDLIIFSSEEFGFFELADAVTTGSSLMPQKKNPDPLELVRGKSGRAIGRLTGWLASMKGLPSGYNKDLQEDKEALFDAEDTVRGSAAAVAAVVSRLSVSGARTQAAASGLLLATEVADYLVSRGMAFRDAHALVGRIVRDLLASGRDFESLSMPDWRAFSDLFEDDVVARVTARAAVDARQTPQSTNPMAVAEALSRLTAWLQNARADRDAG
ncbi:MAG: argininosuccinate lyase [Vicinamibacterales bacterium]|jgi:argininosuccinate lyase|nr:argininosuccinate lyase [Acidobacteriota bacterium]MDP6371402.1 argininosuccinate lyase [Vicinamibacterales bacterium]MDP6607666.1 argininosuccinate lyase [Vicinamibacterales bacterium]HAK56550.1 argininosuccinate lyase [Acidobacteriota bacterium]|tara:strand:+ start:4803 stop:6203 length:1401 start_codon:yes stop_codon:yes gene_type:complete